MFEFALPDVGEGVAEGEIVDWHVAVGDEVAEDDVLAEVETDKAVVDLPSPVAGTVAELHAEEGDVVPVGEVVVTIDPADDADANVEASADADADTETGDESEQASETSEDAEAGRTKAIVRRSSETQASAEATGDDGAGDNGAGEPDDDGTAADEPATAAGRVFAPPHVRRLAREMDIVIDAITGSGPGGRVTAADVREAAGTSGAADEDVADAITEVAPEADVGDGEPGETDGQSSDAGREAAVQRVDADDGAQADTAGEARASSAADAAAADREQTLAAPATRRLADDLDVDLDDVPTDETREGQAFVEPDDVRAYADALEAAEVADAAAMAEREAGVEAPTGAEPTAGQSETREPYRGIRRTIGQQMAQSAATIPHATHHDRAVVDALVDAREAMQSRAEARGIRLTYVPFVLKAVVAGLQDYPVLNSSLDEESEEVVYRHHYDIGVATATDAGLMVPVVRDVDEKGLLQLASDVSELTEKARERSIAREEMQGGTFTITNFGAIGGEYATPIINHPETAILGLGAIEERPVVVDGEVEARHTLPLSLSIDHRVIDGAEAARFVNTVIQYLETPSLLMLE